MRVLVTGASGMIGKTLCRELARRGYRVRAAVRTAGTAPLVEGVEEVCMGDIGSGGDWGEAVGGVDCVFHCAGRAHVVRETEREAVEAFRRVNAAGIRALGQATAAAGVRRVVFVSSIGVLGSETRGDEVFSERSLPRPVDAYGQSKLEAELLLREISCQTGMEAVVVRPPLVYGLGARGSFHRLVRLVASGVPIPLGAVSNRRSFVGIDNLTDLLVRCGEHPHARGETFLVSDGEDLSTPELIRRIAAVMRRRVALVKVPLFLVRCAARLLGRSTEVARLLGSLRVDMSYTCRVLEWSPRVSVDEGLVKALGGN